MWEVADATRDLLFGGILTGWRIELREIPWCPTRGNAKSCTWRIIISSNHIKPAGKFLVREKPCSPGKQVSGQKTAVYPCSKEGWQCMRLHFEERCQQVKDSEPFPLLSTGETYLKYCVQFWALHCKKGYGTWSFSHEKKSNELEMFNLGKRYLRRILLTHTDTWCCITTTYLSV